VRRTGWLDGTEGYRAYEAIPGYEHGRGQQKRTFLPARQDVLKDCHRMLASCDQ
jgi:hypothetical protein